MKEMLSQGVVKPSQSPWASPVVLVKKNDGGITFCVDYRQLNSVTKLDEFPLRTSPHLILPPGIGRSS